MIERPESKQPLPQNATLIFKGKIFDVYQWEQKLFNGTTAIFEKLVRPDTVVVIPITKDGNIIVSTEEQPGSGVSKGVFSGRVEKNEDVELAAKRELLEESGYTAERLVLWKSVQPIHKIEWAVYTFVAYGCEKTQNPELDGGERIEVKEISFDDFIKYATSDDFSEPEIQIEFLKALIKPDYMQKLRELFSA